MRRPTFPDHDFQAKVRAVMRRAVLALFALMLLLPAVARAHPHVWIEHKLDLVMDGPAVRGLHLTWTFDEMYSSMIKEDYTATKDGRIGPADIKRIEREAFSNLANYNYFVEATLDGKPVKFAKVEAFDVRVDPKGRLVYDFTLVIEKIGPRAANELKYAVFDPEYFIEFALAAQSPAKATGNAAVACNPVRRVPRSSPQWGTLSSDRIDCRWPGP